MPRKLTLQEFIDKASQVHNNFYDYSQVNYVNNSTPVTIICPEHGPFSQTPRDHLSKHGCPSCGNCKRTTIASFLKKAVQVHGDKYDYSRVKYKNTKIPVEIICPVHGAFWQSPEKHTTRGQGCPLCKQNHKSNSEEFIEKAREVHGDFYDYSKVEYVNSSTKVCIIDPDYGEFYQTPNAHLNGEGCPSRKQDLIKQTSLEKYGVDNYTKTVEYAKKSQATCLDKYGVSYSFQSQDVRNKSKQTLLKKYGADNAMHVADIRDKMLESKAHNGTFNTSEPEEIMYEALVDIYGIDDVLRQYKSSLYPFSCDFYIKSRDLYIELNASWTHGKHWFDNKNLDDSALLDQYKAKNTDYYDNAVKVWSINDIKKRQTAIDNNLNYIVFWMDNLQDFELWVAMNCPDGNDAKQMYSWLPYHKINRQSVYPRGPKCDAFSDIAKYYMFDVFYRTELDIWNSRRYFRGYDVCGYLYANRYQYLNKLPAKLTDKEILRGFTISGIHKGYTVFDNKLMKRFIEEYNVKSIYDPCAGWGERLLTCHELGIEYLGVDINYDLAGGYTAMLSDLGLCPQKILLRDSSKYVPANSFEAVLTCPPYRNIEVYSPFGAENLGNTEFEAWWGQVVANSVSMKPKYFCFQINTGNRDWMLKVVEQNGYKLINEYYFSSTKSSHFTRGKDIDYKKSRESMLILQRND